MEIINQIELIRFARKHPKARSPVYNWINTTTTVSWRNFLDVRQTFRSADYVKPFVVFDIGGNNYRLITSVDYLEQKVWVVEVFTHNEYNRWQP